MDICCTFQRYISNENILFLMPLHRYLPLPNNVCVFSVCVLHICVTQKMITVAKRFLISNWYFPKTLKLIFSAINKYVNYNLSIQLVTFAANKPATSCVRVCACVRKWYVLFYNDSSCFRIFFFALLLIKFFWLFCMLYKVFFPFKSPNVLKILIFSWHFIWMMQFYRLLS